MKQDKKPSSTITFDLAGILERIDRQHWIIKGSVYFSLNVLFIFAMSISLILLWNMHPLVLVVVVIFLIPTVITTSKELIHSFKSTSIKDSLLILIVLFDIVIISFLFILEIPKMDFLDILIIILLQR